MSDNSGLRHPLVPLRRWLLTPGSEYWAVGALLLVAAVMAALASWILTRT